MDDISEKLAEILNDPDSLNRVREMAENILGNDNKKENSAPPKNDINSLFGGVDIDPEGIGRIMSVMSRLKNSKDDSRSNLLLALKPHLSAPRREKVDTAIKLLKIIDLLPLLKDSGLFEF